MVRVVAMPTKEKQGTADYSGRDPAAQTAEDAERGARGGVAVHAAAAVVRGFGMATRRRASSWPAAAGYRCAARVNNRRVGCGRPAAAVHQPDSYELYAPSTKKLPRSCPLSICLIFRDFQEALPV
jgi:hypothetical protein